MEESRPRSSFSVDVEKEKQMLIDQIPHRSFFFAGIWHWDSYHWSQNNMFFFPVQNGGAEQTCDKGCMKGENVKERSQKWWGGHWTWGERHSDSGWIMSERVHKPSGLAAP